MCFFTSKVLLTLHTFCLPHVKLTIWKTWNADCQLQHRNRVPGDSQQKYDLQETTMLLCMTELCSEEIQSNCWCHQVQLLLTPSRQNLLMVAWGQAVKIAYTMSPCLFWQDFFPWLLWLGFFRALTQGLFPFLSLPIFSQTIMMNTCNWNKNIQDVYAITTSYILWRKTLQKSFVLIHHNWLLKIWWLKKFSSEKCFCK